MHQILKFKNQLRINTMLVVLLGLGWEDIKMTQKFLPLENTVIHKPQRKHLNVLCDHPEK